MSRLFFVPASCFCFVLSGKSLCAIKIFLSVSFSLFYQKAGKRERGVKSTESVGNEWEEEEEKTNFSLSLLFLISVAWEIAACGQKDA